MPDGGRRRRAPRWTRSAVRRPAAFITLFLLSMLAIAVSILTPMLLRSVQQVSLDQGVSGAAPLDRTLTAHAIATAGTAVDSAVAATTAIGGSVGPSRWEEPVTAAGSVNEYPWRVAGRARAESGFLAVAPDDTCGTLRVTQGRCPQDVLQVLLPASTQSRLHASIGSRLDLSPGTSSAKVLTVVGVYDDGTGLGRVLAAPDALSGTTLSQPSAALVLGSRHTERLGLDLISYVVLAVKQPIALDSIPDLLLDVRSAVSQATSDVGAQTTAEVASGLPALLARLQTQNDAAGIVAAAIAFEVLALAWFAESGVIRRVSRVRAVEWGIGRTRGIVLGDWLVTVFAEPLIAILAGGLAGLPLGVAAAVPTARVALGPAAVIEPLQGPALAAAGFAIAGSLVALVVASVRSARLPLPSLLRETTEPRQLSRPALVVQASAIVVTLVVVWVVVTQTTVSGPQVALLAPALIAFTLGTVALRLTVIVMRGATARSPRSLSGLVVGRQLARAPSALGGAVMVAMSLALAVYVLSLSAVADRLQDDRAASDVGAATVLQVAVPSGTTVVDAVRKADPSGRRAMAAREVDGLGATGTGRIIAVDSARLDAVTTWRPEWRGPAGAFLERRLDPPTSAPLTVTGTRLTLTLTGVHAPGDDSDPDVRLHATIDTGDGWRTVDFGLLRNGALDSPAGAVPCGTGCRLVDLSLLNPDTATTSSFEERFTLAAISTDRQSSAVFASWLTRGDRWRERIVDSSDPSMPTDAGSFSTPNGLHLQMDADAGGEAAVIEPITGSETLPAVMAAGTDADAFAGVEDGVFGSDLTGAPLVLSVFDRPEVLPRVGGSGVLVDIGQLQRVSDTAAAAAVDEVWLAPGPQTAVRAALKAEGVRIVSTQTEAAAAARNRAEAPARTLAIMLATAAAALLLALLALIGGRSVDAGPRRRDQRTLRSAGLRGRALARLSAIEFAVPSIAGALVGVLAGLLAFGLTVGRLPLLAGDPPSPPLDLAPPLTALALLVLSSVAVVLIVAATLSASGSRRSEP